MLHLNLFLRKGLFIFWLILIFTAIALIFWHNEWVYSLPTPVPENYREIKQGAYIDIDSKLKTEKNKPVFLHFYNPDCPCSRFNIPHIRSLVKSYSSKVTFAIVLMSEKSEYTAREIQDKFGLSIPVLSDKSIAASCGVYSTPQAAILNSDHSLYYRGNYNKSRYCTDKKSNYAQMAIDSLLKENAVPAFNASALKAYGCELPNCNKP
jgi:hypothetical protein